MLGRARRFARTVDDTVQGFARDVYGANDENKYDANTLQGKIATFGHMMHPRIDVDDVNHVGVGLTRAAQLAGLTAAGYGLMKLTEQFGGAADQQERGQLSLTEEEQQDLETVRKIQAAALVGASTYLGMQAGEMYLNRKRS